MALHLSLVLLVAEAQDLDGWRGHRRCRRSWHDGSGRWSPPQHVGRPQLPDRHLGIAHQDLLIDHARHNQRNLVASVARTQHLADRSSVGGFLPVDTGDDIASVQPDIRRRAADIPIRSNSKCPICLARPCLEMQADPLLVAILVQPPGDLLCIVAADRKVDRLARP